MPNYNYRDETDRREGYSSGDLARAPVVRFVATGFFVLVAGGSSEWKRLEDLPFGGWKVASGEYSA